MAAKWADIDDNASAPAVDEKQDTKLTKVSSDGVKTVIEFYTNEKGQKIKVTRVLKLVKKPARVNKHIAARRKWAKFGDCAGLPPGPEENVTHKSHEIIRLDLRPRLDRDEDKEEADARTAAAALKGDDGKTVVCRNCGEAGHWSLKCPKRQTIVPVGMEEEDAPTGGGGGGGGAAGAGADGKYVPMHLRAGAEAKAAADNFRDDTFTVRITNLSEDTTESDLQDLCRRFGYPSRIYLAKDKQTFKSRGFAFVNFHRREEAQACIDKLNGWGYDNLILAVEWAKPQAPRPQGEGGDREEGGGGGGRRGGRGGGDFGGRGGGRGGGGRGGGGGFGGGRGGGRGGDDGAQRPRLALQPRTKK